MTKTPKSKKTWHAWPTAPGPRARGPLLPDGRAICLRSQVWPNEALLSVVRHSVECRTDRSEKRRTPVLSSSFLQCVTCLPRG